MSLDINTKNNNQTNNNPSNDQILDQREVEDSQFILSQFDRSDQDLASLLLEEDDKSSLPTPAKTANSKYEPHVFHMFLVGILFAGLSLAMINTVNNITMANIPVQNNFLTAGNDNILNNNVNNQIIENNTIENSTKNINLPKRELHPVITGMQSALDFGRQLLKKNPEAVGTLIPITSGENKMCVMLGYDPFNVESYRMCDTEEKICIDGLGDYRGCYTNILVD